MTVELVRAAPQPLEFTYDGSKLFARKLPFRLAMRLRSDEVDAEIMAEIIMACVIKKNGEPVFTGVDEVLDFDSDQMIRLFQAVSAGMITAQEAGKNSKASR